MIGYLKGKIISVKPTKILMDVNGVGYLVNISINTFERITDQEVTSLFIHTSVKEDSITLYGFYTESEKEMFELLISVNGIGPRLAQSILSGIQVAELKDAIHSGNISRIIAVPGIGKKTAERLLLELKTKVDHVTDMESTTVNYSLRREAVTALTTLGYNLKIAEKSVMDCISENPSITLEELIKKTLSKLNR